MRIRKLISPYLLGLLPIFMVFNVFASTIVPSAGQDDEVSFFNLEGNATDDFLKIRPANASGISVNKFDTFSVTPTKPLRILNTKGLVGDEITSAADIIIIEADNIQLNGTIEIIGPLADLVFISTSSGSVSCNVCDIQNVFRATLAVANRVDANNGVLPIDTLLTNIGALKATAGGSVSINGMNAIGALAVEVVANTLNLAGSIDTHQSATELPEGGFEVSSIGDKKIGSASFSAAIGDVKWDFDTQNLLSANPSSGSSSLEGQVNAVSAKFWSSYPLTFKTEIDTRTDALSSIHYRSWDAENSRYVDKNHITNESISIQALHGVSGNTDIGGMLNSNNSIIIRSMGDLSFSSKYITVQTHTYLCGSIWNRHNHTVTYNVTTFNNIEAPEISLLAAGDVGVGAYAKIISDNLGLAGENIYNRGRLAASMKIEGFASNNLINQFGGRLQASALHLQAENGFVRNGSRTPFVPDESQVAGLLDYKSSDLVVPDGYKIGTFYKNGMQFDLSEEQFEGSMHSLLIGNDIVITAKAFENINPYWEQIDPAQDPNEFAFQEGRVNQIGVHATNSIKIKTEKYVLNSSAGIVSDNTVQFESPIIINERYRVLSILEEYSDTDHPDGSPLLEYKDSVVAYSPPGLIMAMGDFTARALHGFSNKASHFEVGGNGRFLANKVNYYGVESGRNFAESYYTTYHDESRSCGSFGWDRCWTRDIPTHHLDIVTADPTQLDSLFSIGGDALGQKFSVDGSGSVILGEGVDLDMKTIEVFDAFVDDLVKDLFAWDSYDGFNTSKSVNEESNTLTTIQYVKSDENCDPNAPDLQVPIDVGGITIFIPVRDCQLIDKYTPTEYDFLEQMGAYFDRMVAIMNSWLDDLDWWN
ncbi:MAG: hypothetical protein RPS47_05640 [Colwellia sp.]|jgi:hypothetical protein